MEVFAKRINAIDNSYNCECVAHDIANDFVKSNDIPDTELYDYVVKYLTNQPLADLLALDLDNLFAKVYDSIVNEIANRYPTEVRTLVEQQTRDLDIDQIFDILVNGSVTLDINVNNALADTDDTDTDDTANYNFSADVYFGVTDNSGMDSYDVIESELKTRFGKRGKWRASKLVGLATSLTNGKYGGLFTLHIYGNDTYTPDTIKKAITNRVGDTAKKSNPFLVKRIDISNR